MDLHSDSLMHLASNNCQFLKMKKFGGCIGDKLHQILVLYDGDKLAVIEPCPSPIIKVLLQRDY